MKTIDHCNQRLQEMETRGWRLWNDHPGLTIEALRMMLKPHGLSLEIVEDVEDHWLWFKVEKLKPAVPEPTDAQLTPETHMQDDKHPFLGRESDGTSIWNVPEKHSVYRVSPDGSSKLVPWWMDSYDRGHA
jgi:hypothetical protein